MDDLFTELVGVVGISEQLQTSPENEKCTSNIVCCWATITVTLLILICCIVLKIKGII